MKRFITVLLISVSLLFGNIAHASTNYYISIAPYPYSSHILGEELVIYADTNAPAVILGLYSLRPNGSVNKFIHSSTLFPSELKNGYSIPTSTVSGAWQEGDYLLLLQYGSVRAEKIIRMTSSPVYDRNVIISEYSDNTLVNTASYRCRGIAEKNGVYELSLENGTLIKIYSWNNFNPASEGKTTLFVTTYQDGFMTSTKHYNGFLSKSLNHFTLETNDGGKLKLFVWNDNLNPVN